MSEVGTTRGTANLGANHPQRAVVNELNGLRVDGFVEAGPTASGIELGTTFKKFGVTTGAGVKTGTFLIEELARPGPLGGGFTQNSELLLA